MSKKARHTDGFIIVVVLCLIVLLAVILLGFNNESRAALRAAEQFSRSRQALNCATAGVNIAIAAFKNDDIYSSRTIEKLLSGGLVFDIGPGSCSVSAADESSKLNLNLLQNGAGTLNRARIEQFLRLIDLLNRQLPDRPIAYDLAAAVIDWTDSDDQTTCLPFVKFHNLGAESSYYASLNPPYACANAPMESIDDLLLLKGIDQQTFEMLCRYTTVDGEGEININTAPAAVLQCLSEQMDAALARTIVERRNIKPFGDIIELQAVPGMTDSIYYEIRRTATTRPSSNHFQVVSTGTVGQTTATVVAAIRIDDESKGVEVVSYKEIGRKDARL